MFIQKIFLRANYIGVPALGTKSFILLGTRTFITRAVIKKTAPGFQVLPVWESERRNEQAFRIWREVLERISRELQRLVPEIPSQGRVDEDREYEMLSRYGAKFPMTRTWKGSGSQRERVGKPSGLGKRCPS